MATGERKKRPFGVYYMVFLILHAIRVVKTTNIDCGGKAFYCLNSTNFMICVDQGNGIAMTVDDMSVPCPPGTECQPDNIFECEFPRQTTPSMSVPVTTNSVENATGAVDVSVSTPIVERNTTVVKTLDYFTTDSPITTESMSAYYDSNTTAREEAMMNISESGLSTEAIQIFTTSSVKLLMDSSNNSDGFPVTTNYDTTLISHEVTMNTLSDFTVDSKAITNGNISVASQSQDIANRNTLNNFTSSPNTTESKSTGWDTTIVREATTVNTTKNGLTSDKDVLPTTPLIQELMNSSHNKDIFIDLLNNSESSSTQKHLMNTLAESIAETSTSATVAQSKVTTEKYYVTTNMPIITTSKLTYFDATIPPREEIAATETEIALNSGKELLYSTPSVQETTHLNHSNERPFSTKNYNETETPQEIAISDFTMALDYTTTSLPIYIGNDSTYFDSIVNPREEFATNKTERKLTSENVLLFTPLSIQTTTHLNNNSEGFSVAKNHNETLITQEIATSKRTYFDTTVPAKEGIAANETERGLNSGKELLYSTPSVQETTHLNHSNERPFSTKNYNETETIQEIAITDFTMALDYTTTNLPYYTGNESTYFDSTVNPREEFANNKTERGLTSENVPLFTTLSIKTTTHLNNYKEALSIAENHNKTSITQEIATNKLSDFTKGLEDAVDMSTVTVAHLESTTEKNTLDYITTTLPFITTSNSIYTDSMVTPWEETTANKTERGLNSKIDRLFTIPSTQETIQLNHNASETFTTNSNMEILNAKETATNKLSDATVAPKDTLKVNNSTGTHSQNITEKLTLDLTTTNSPFITVSNITYFDTKVTPREEIAQNKTGRELNSENNLLFTTLSTQETIYLNHNSEGVSITNNHNETFMTYETTIDGLSDSTIDIKYPVTESASTGTQFKGITEKNTLDYITTTLPIITTSKLTYFNSTVNLMNEGATIKTEEEVNSGKNLLLITPDLKIESNTTNSVTDQHANFATTDTVMDYTSVNEIIIKDLVDERKSLDTFTTVVPKEKNFNTTHTTEFPLVGETSTKENNYDLNTTEKISSISETNNINTNENKFMSDIIITPGKLYNNSNEIRIDTTHINKQVKYENINDTKNSTNSISHKNDETFEKINKNEYLYNRTGITIITTQNTTDLKFETDGVTPSEESFTNIYSLTINSTDTEGKPKAAGEIKQNYNISQTNTESTDNNYGTLSEFGKNISVINETLVKFKNPIETAREVNKDIINNISDSQIYTYDENTTLSPITVDKNIQNELDIQSQHTPFNTETWDTTKSPYEQNNLKDSIYPSGNQWSDDSIATVGTYTTNNTSPIEVPAISISQATTTIFIDGISQLGTNKQSLENGTLDNADLNNPVINDYLKPTGSTESILYFDSNMKTEHVEPNFVHEMTTGVVWDATKATEANFPLNQMQILETTISNVVLIRNESDNDINIVARTSESVTVTEPGPAITNNNFTNKSIKNNQFTNEINYFTEIAITETTQKTPITQDESIQRITNSSKGKIQSNAETEPYTSTKFVTKIVKNNIVINSSEEKLPSSNSFITLIEDITDKTFYESTTQNMNLISKMNSSFQVMTNLKFEGVNRSNEHITETAQSGSEINKLKTTKKLLNTTTTIPITHSIVSTEESISQYPVNLSVDNSSILNNTTKMNINNNIHSTVKITTDTKQNASGLQNLSNVSTPSNVNLNVTTLQYNTGNDKNITNNENGDERIFALVKKENKIYYRSKNLTDFTNELVSTSLPQNTLTTNSENYKQFDNIRTKTTSELQTNVEQNLDTQSNTYDLRIQGSSDSANIDLKSVSGVITKTEPTIFRDIVTEIPYNENMFVTKELNDDAGKFYKTIDVDVISNIVTPHEEITTETTFHFTNPMNIITQMPMSSTNTLSSEITDKRLKTINNYITDNTAIKASNLQAEKNQTNKVSDLYAKENSIKEKVTIEQKKYFSNDSILTAVQTDKIETTTYPYENAIPITENIPTLSKEPNINVPYYIRPLGNASEFGKNISWNFTDSQINLSTQNLTEIKLNEKSDVPRNSLLVQNQSRIVKDTSENTETMQNFSVLETTPTSANSISSTYVRGQTKSDVTNNIEENAYTVNTESVSGDLQHMIHENNFNVKNTRDTQVKKEIVLENSETTVIPLLLNKVINTMNYPLTEKTIKDFHSIRSTVLDEKKVENEESYHTTSNISNPHDSVLQEKAEDNLQVPDLKINIIQESKKEAIARTEKNQSHMGVKQSRDTFVSATVEYPSADVTENPVNLLKTPSVTKNEHAGLLLSSKKDTDMNTNLANKIHHTTPTVFKGDKSIVTTDTQKYNKRSDTTRGNSYTLGIHGNTNETEFSTKPGNKHPDTSSAQSQSSHFSCANRKRGRYGDIVDCKIFYVCIGKHNPIIGRCPPNTVFSDMKKQCTKILSECIRQDGFECTTEGRFIDYFETNVYYICVRNKKDNKYVRFKFHCQAAYYLRADIIKCVHYDTTSDTGTDSRTISTDESSRSDNSNKSDGSRNSSKEKKSNERHKGGNEKSTGENHNSSEDSSVDVFRCVNEGKFPDYRDCRRYYECKKSHGSLRRKKRKCDKGEVFHNEKKKCVDAESHECT